MSERQYARQRARLVTALQQHGINHPAVLAAFEEVPRHRFVPEAVRRRAYEDTALPIGYGQTISQPSIHALYLQTLQLTPSDKVLEVGTGSGFQTALLARLADRVYSMERVAELTARARLILDELGATNVALMTGDGTVGWSRYAPYDAILVGAGAPTAPPALLDQLAPDGKLLIPLGDRNGQNLTLFRRIGEGYETEEIIGCIFVPLVGRFGWAE